MGAISKTKIVTKGSDKKKLFLFGGLFLFALSGLSFLAGFTPMAGFILMAGGVSLKTLFLIQLFRTPDFKVSLEIYLILFGVALILISLLFKNIFPFPLLRNIFFYSAITLKITGVTLLFFQKKK